MIRKICLVLSLFACLSFLFVNASAVTVKEPSTAMLSVSQPNNPYCGADNSFPEFTLPDVPPCVFPKIRDLNCSEAAGDAYLAEMQSARVQACAGWDISDILFQDALEGILNEMAGCVLLAQGQAALDECIESAQSQISQAAAVDAEYKQSVADRYEARADAAEADYRAAMRLCCVNF